MKHAFRLSRVGAVAAAALAVLYSAIILAGAQANVATSPDPFIVQLTSSSIPPTPPATATPTPSPTPTPTATPTASPTPARVPRNSFAADIDNTGRFVVIESNGDIATERTNERNNADGNQEIFLLDYAQRRIFQITNTKNAVKNTALSPISGPNIEVEVVNLRPQLSRDGRYLAFISNAYVSGATTLGNGCLVQSPKDFDGEANEAGLKQDGNTEIFLYEVPQPPAVDLTSGAEVPFADMASGCMRRITDTPASVLPTAGTDILPPTFARDNDAPAVSNDTQAGGASGIVVAFQSRARAGNVTNGDPQSNPDGNAEIFLYEDDNLDAAGATFVQVTRTADVAVPNEPLPRLVFNNNASLSADGRRLAFISNADNQIAGPAAEAEAGRGNGEIYVADYNEASNTVGAMRRVTTTTPVPTSNSINTLSPGKRMSPNGNFLLFESFAVFNDTGTVTDTSLVAVGIYLYDIPNNRFTEVVQRPPTADQQQDIGIRWPTFTGDSLRVVWSSILNLRPDGTVAPGDDAAGLNPLITVNGVNRRPTQIFSSPVSNTRQVSRLTRMRGSFDAIQPFPSNTIERIAFTTTLELGGGNADGTPEAFYLRIPRPDAAASPSPTPAAVSFFTGATERPVVAASPAPSPSPDVAVTGLAPGELSIARSTLAIGPVLPREVAAGDAHETNRRPPLPVELGNVSVSVDDAAAGLYSVAPNQINFVVPPGLVASSTPLRVVIHNNGTTIYTTLLIHPAQPDIFSSTNGAGGRAAALNVTNPCISPPGEPFPTVSTRPAGSNVTGNCTGASETVPTELMFMVTGLRNATPAQVTVRIGTVDISGANILSVGPSLTPGFDQVVVRLPATNPPTGDLPVVITANIGGVNFTSRPEATAPRVLITAPPAP